jgi:hypothetical protein
VEAHLLYRVGDVKPGEDEVLESPKQATLGSQVIGSGSHTGGDLGPECRPTWCNMKLLTSFLAQNIGLASPFCFG